jgi:hypothetical protein
MVLNFGTHPNGRPRLQSTLIFWLGSSRLPSKQAFSLQFHTILPIQAIACLEGLVMALAMSSTLWSLKVIAFQLWNPFENQSMNRSNFGPIAKEFSWMKLPDRQVIKRERRIGRIWIRWPMSYVS